MRFLIQIFLFVFLLISHVCAENLKEGHSEESVESSTLVELANRYFYGYSGVQNGELSFYYFRKAAELGDANG